MLIATFNLENLGGDKLGSTINKQLLIHRPQLERFRADIICLQEANAVRQKFRKTARLLP